MNNDKIKELLADSYLDISNIKGITNEMMLNAINKFINRDDFIEIEDNNMFKIRRKKKLDNEVIMNIRYVSDRDIAVINKYNNCYYYPSIIKINGVRKIMLLESTHIVDSNSFELTPSSVSKNDMAKIYNAFVYNILDYKYHFRIIKELTETVQSLTNKFLVKRTNNTISYMKISKIYFTKENLQYHLHIMRYKINIYSNKQTSDFFIKEIHNFNDLRSFIFDSKTKYDIIDANDLDKIKSKYVEKLEEIITSLREKQNNVNQVDFSFS